MDAELGTLERLMAQVAARADATPEVSWTARLLAGGPARVAKKLGEEGVEAALAVASGTEAEVTAEVADLLYHLCVALLARGVSLEAVAAELSAREARSGLAEKAARG
jgi:phosphoribosyl-ATP pyrophosphohydrolase